jgi:transposase
VCDNYATRNTPEIRAWLARHPRFHVHFTPTGSSWMNQVVRHEVACDKWRSSKGDRLMSVT